MWNMWRMLINFMPLRFFVVFFGSCCCCCVWPISYLNEHKKKKTNDIIICPMRFEWAFFCRCCCCCALFRFCFSFLVSLLFFSSKCKCAVDFFFFVVVFFLVSWTKPKTLQAKSRQIQRYKSFESHQIHMNNVIQHNRYN